ncbi:lysophospholipid acyltransferase family protein [Allostreptomyces psammosilenae]|uniref:lysophospholipid acyltransferase family protein n=1 Tax=Allostreptomyces psammosilenae TaxID=1892865 RepID=UPI0015C90E6C
MLYQAVRAVGGPAARLLFRPRVEGLHNIPRTGPVILASNHLSFIDSVVIPLIVPRRVAFLAKAEYFEGTGLRGRAKRAFFGGVGNIPVQRNDQRGALASLEIAMGVLHDGGAFGIYPEGSRSRDGRLYRGRTGVGWLALASKAPVVPVGLIGTDRMQPVGSNLPRYHRITVRFGEPMDFSAHVGRRDVGKARREVTDAVMSAIHELSGQEYAGVFNEHATAE